MTSSSPFHPGDVIAGKYRVERVLGQGGMGVVLAATHLELKRLVALKFMLAGTVSRQAEGRFLREARAAAGLTSPHSVRIYDFGRLEEGAAFLVMEYLEGTDLAALVERQGPLSVPLAVEYILQASVGLAEAHARGIVHRDIKPQNLFLTTSASGAALVKVLDFGVSKVTPAFSGFDETKSGVVLGSPGYMAPEQMRAAHEVDARADIWALGCTLYNLLSGGDPFDAGSLAELCAQVLHGEPRSLLTLRPLPAALARQVHSCLAKEPAQRPSSLAVLAAGLVPFAPASGPALLAAVQGALSGGQAASGLALQPATQTTTSDAKRKGFGTLAWAVLCAGLLAAVVVALRTVPHVASGAVRSQANALPPPPPTAPVLRQTEPAPDVPVVDASAQVAAPTPDAGAVGGTRPRRRASPQGGETAQLPQPAPAAQPAPPAAEPEPTVAEPDERDPRLMRH